MALSASLHGLLRVAAHLKNSGSHPFLIDTGAEISLLLSSWTDLASVSRRFPPRKRLETDARTDSAEMKWNRHLARQPVMVDGTSIRCEGTVTTSLQLGPREVTAQFYVVPGISDGILGMDILAKLDLQIDTGSRRLFIDNQEISQYEWIPSQHNCDSAEVRLVRYGRVYAVTDATIPPNAEYTVWGRVHTTGQYDTEKWLGVVEVTEDLSTLTGLIGCCTLVEGGPTQSIPVRVYNVSDQPIRIYKRQTLAEFTEVSAETQNSHSNIAPSDIQTLPIGPQLTDEQQQTLRDLLTSYQGVCVSW